ncbi:TRAP transporter small permease [Aquabacter spiritensis]|uniref:TRAP transporter small permease protein n=1 Tax=Aquabacter spiritensis TaxID=933073 RepID=A0A4R3LWW7_9HYPH|nr:TRAP transporter small permease [Aquabacter spiritensis]TCT05124.1 TRAP-type C4-dicarboxylate transport system permease small subunit [Aquabacter spiritensis]
MRTLLDRLYGTALFLAAACLALIAILVGAQVLGRVYDMILKLFGHPAYGFIVEGLPEIAGYLLAGASLLALAGTFKSGAHIRVLMLLQAVPAGGRKAFEVLAHVIGLGLSGFATWSLLALTLESIRYKEVSYGLVPVPLALPQAVMTLGLAILTIAFLDELLHVLRTGRPSYSVSEDAVTLGKEG